MAEPVGTDNDDHLVCTDAPSTVNGMGGDDTVEGMGGDDFLYGWLGADTLIGGLGNDYLDAGTANGAADLNADHLEGEQGNDSLFGYAGDDYLDGGIDNDRLSGGLGSDLLFGGDGVDFLYGSDEYGLRDDAAMDSLDGGDGADFIYVFSGGADIRGGDGADLIYTARFLDAEGRRPQSEIWIEAEEGADTMVGGLGFTHMDGGIGDDVISLMLDEGEYSGGDGFDIIQIGSNSWHDPSLARPVFIDLTDLWHGGIGLLVFDFENEGQETFAQFLKIEAFTELNGSMFNDYIDLGADYALGGRVVAGEGDDTVYGTSNNDEVQLGGGSDFFYGGGGIDAAFIPWDPGTFEIVQGEDAATWIVRLLDHSQEKTLVWVEAVDANNKQYIPLALPQTIFTGGGDVLNFNALTKMQMATVKQGAFLYDAMAGDDQVRLPDTAKWTKLGWDNDHPFDAGQGDDRVTGGNGADYIAGGAGADTLTSAAGAGDLMEGGWGNDSIVGAGGDDLLFGDEDNDILVGQGGADDLAGGDGNDALSGGDGADTLTGGEGKDRLVGGAGADIYMFDDLSDSTAKRYDTIKGWESKDVMDILVDADASEEGDQALVYGGQTAAAAKLIAGQVQWYHLGGDTYVVADVTGDGRADFKIKLVGEIALVANDFVL